MGICSSYSDAEMLGCDRLTVVDIIVGVENLNDVNHLFIVGLVVIDLVVVVIFLRKPPLQDSYDICDKLAEVAGRTLLSGFGVGDAKTPLSPQKP